MNSYLKIYFFTFILYFTGLTYAQTTVSGTISDADGPLPGANIIVQGTTIGTTTDFDGIYKLDNVPLDGVLEASFIGYITQTIHVNGQSEVNMTLVEDINQLNEVVVTTGYLTQIRGDITGSVASVDIDEAMKQPIINVGEVLQGRVTGVTVINNNEPGAAPKIAIRGYGTINNTDPLFIIDGVQSEDPEILNNINANDIAEVNVLKDGAASIYGARASNGVIIITTKSGGYDMSKAVLNVDMYTGFSQISNPPSLLNTQQHADMIWEGFNNDGIVPSHGQYGSGPNPVIPSSIIDFEKVISYDPTVWAPQDVPVKGEGTDWIDAVTQTAPTTSIAISLANGSDTGKYFMSVGYLNRTGVIIYSGFERLSTRLNSEFRIIDKLKIGEHVNISYTNTAQVFPIYGGAMRNSPLMSVRDDDGNFIEGRAPDMNTTNSVAFAYNDKNDYQKRYTVFGDIYLSYDIMDALTFKTVLAGGFNTYDTRYFNPRGVNNERNQLTEQDHTSYNWIWTNTLNYNKSFGKHKINALIGIEALKNSSKGKSISRTDYLIEDPDYYLLNNGSGTPTVEYAYDGYNTLYSIFGTANYSFRNKYFGTITVRRDESSRFKGDNKSDVFPSFSVGWVMSKENFFNEDGMVNRLKLKASWGELGNQTLPADNPTVNIASLSEQYANYSFNGTGIATGVYLTQVGNPNLKWETSVTANAGIELSMLKNRLIFELETYQITTKGLITRDYGSIGSTAIDAEAPLVNLGDIKNTGLDFSVGYHDKTNSGWSYGIDLNLSHYKNEVINLIDSIPVPGTSGYTRTEVGKEMSFFYGRKIIGFTDEGRWRYEDVTVDGIVNDDDRTKIGSPHPDFTYGINLSLAYKGFDASLFFTGSQGNEIINTSKLIDFPSSSYSNRSTRVLNAWTPTNTNPISLPALSNTVTNNETDPNTYFVEDGSYFRLKNIQIGYTLPKKATVKARISSLRFYVQASNLFTLTKYEGFDPEIVSYDNLNMGVDYRVYPGSKIYTVGVNLNF
jgi:TonB-linked SusC/RagA family outer membrane protein